MSASPKEEGSAAAPRRGDQGGRDSLAGYLFQVLGTAAYRAMASSVKETDEEVDSHLRLIRTGTIKGESLGQDAELFGGLDGKLTRILVQFKYSRLNPPKPIGQAEVLEIARKLHDSAAEATVPVEAVGYLLVSNRPFNPDANSVIEAARAGTPHDALLRKKGQERVLSVMAYQQVKLTTWLSALNAYAASLGVPPAEAVRRRAELVGRLMVQTAAGESDVDDRLLREVFTGDQAARLLSWGELGPLVSVDLEKFRQDANVDRRLAPRRVIDEIAEHAAQRSLVLVTGEGGRGKSAGMYQALLGVTEGSDPVPVAAFLASRPPEGGLREIVAHWRNLPASQDGGTDQLALERAMVARPKRRPALIVGLDGLDEISDGTRGSVLKLLNFFWELDRSGPRGGGTENGPAAVLVVTCRDRNRFMTEWLQAGRGFDYEGHQPAEVLISDFAERELLRAAKVAQLPADVLRGLAEILAPDAVEDLALSALVVPRSMDETIVRSLLHPAMWRAFLQLSPGNQSQALENGSHSATDPLASKFTVWFCEKTTLRRASPGVSLDPQQWEQMLDAVGARHPRPPERALRMLEWTEPARCDGEYRDSHARHLYNEALSSGVIREVQKGFWSWRHDFVRAHLARRAIGRS